MELEGHKGVWIPFVEELRCIYQVKVEFLLFYIVEYPWFLYISENSDFVIVCDYLISDLIV